MSISQSTVRQALTSRARQRSRRRRVLVENLQGWLFASPFIVGLLTLFLCPMLASLYLSLTSYPIAQAPRFVGVRNYVEMTHDPLIWQALRVTTKFALISVPLSLFVGLGIAVLLNQKVHALGFWRTVCYLPSVVSGVAVALMWRWLFDSRYGLVNYILELLFGIEGPNWLGDTRFVLIPFIAVSIWTCGSAALINLAALQGVPTALHEAALVDGANSWQRFRHITVPTISPVIFFNLVMGIIYALRSFTLFFILTGGGPNNRTLTFMLYLYNTAFSYFRMGYASAMAWLLFAYLAILTLLVFRGSSRWVFYEAQVR